ncbi:hypothetical protein D9V37_06460 [Nocardioides mangrovicus]|uniref:DUF559 domain-containing protein n=1 Tax=Nocardioides mangrovicus TaxID=2478913 RepID=A0A3L8P4D1_9ACTN|nr:hypothetical protein [Nocardioides mangrovicus]RLV49563.1 hypothetical protein D9V37_06460 [Nocardioides mangrovicus]
MHRALTLDDLHARLAYLPDDAPFTAEQVAQVGMGDRHVTRLLMAGSLRRLVKGVYVRADVEDSLALRCAAVRLVVPDDAVVTDRTAGWLHGAEMVLAPNDHLKAPTVSAFQRRRGGRLRNDLTASGQRLMPDSDVVELMGLRVTTPLRTALDLGRLLHRDQAFAAMGQMLRVGVDQDEALGEVRRFAGFRGVRQLRELLPLVDARVQSPPESVLHLRWLECSDLPVPELQLEVPGPRGSSFFLDLGVSRLRLGAEYDGWEWHSGERAEDDAQRRAWIRNRLGYLVLVFRREQLFGPRENVGLTLRRAVYERTRRLGA